MIISVFYLALFWGYSKEEGQPLGLILLPGYIFFQLFSISPFYFSDSRPVLQLVSEGQALSGTTLRWRLTENLGGGGAGTGRADALWF